MAEYSYDNWKSDESNTEYSDKWNEPEPEFEDEDERVSYGNTGDSSNPISSINS